MTRLFHHIFPQHAIDAALIPLAAGFEPRHHVRIEPQTDRLLDRPVKTPALCAAPVRQRRRVAQIERAVAAVAQLEFGLELRAAFGRCGALHGWLRARR